MAAIVRGLLASTTAWDTPAMSRTAQLFVVTAMLYGTAGVTQASILTLTETKLTWELYGITLPDALLIPLEVTHAPNVPVFVSSGTGNFVLPAGAVSGSASTTLPINSLLDVHLIAPGNGSFSLSAGGGPAGGFGGVGGLSGLWVAGILGGVLNLSIPLSPVGAGGTAAAPVSAAGINLTLTGSSGWTTGGVTFTGLSLQPSPPISTIQTVSREGTDTRTVGHRGSLSLVTPIRVTSGNFGGGWVGFVTLDLTFVPEPGTLVLGGVAVAGIALAGRRRNSRRR